jgi:tRNA-2-methylthio-N6-dimethylallyladenosine synthase
MSDEPSTTATTTATPAGAPKRVLIETWGCQMNAADSESMLALLRERNFEVTHALGDADLVVLNTCHIREKAKHKVLSRLGEIREHKDERAEGRELTIAVAGCVAQAEGAKLLKAAPGIDVLLGPGQIEELPRLLGETKASGKSAVALGFKKGRGEDGHDRDHARVQEAKPTVTGRREVTRFVNIQQGCDNFCTFCVVPHTRGREVSRAPAEVLDEVRALVRAGAVEITLLGQNVNSYGGDLVESGAWTRTGLRGPVDGASPFVALLAATAELPGVERVRFTTSNPHDFSPELARLFATQPKLGRYVHLPVQSGSDAVLARMRRKVTAAEYRERVAWLRAAAPDLALSTDLIVGFPGETEAQFEETLALADEVGFSFAFSFKYSPRRNTPAARFPDQVPEDVKEARLARLNAVLDRHTVAQQRAEIGAEREVLFLYEASKTPGHYYGRTPHFRLVRVPAPYDVVGKTLKVRITDGNKTALLGELV